MNRIDRKTATALVSLAADIETQYKEAEELLSALEPRFARINELRTEAAELMDGEAADAENYFDDKSEKWQEGERGELFGEWRDKLREVADALGEEVDTPDISIERPDWLTEITDQEWEEFTG